MRLDKFLTECFIGTRSEVKKIIKKKQIFVNDICITSESYNINLEKDIVEYNDKVLKYQEYYYFILNKPSGYICATSDNYHKTILELFRDLPTLLVNKLFPVGRLDIDTEGLLIVTNDGNFSHMITSPNSNINKTYYVEYDLPLPNNVKELVSKEIVLKDGTIFKKSIIEVINEHSCYLTITEGQFHQVKRIIKYLGSNVTYLKRISIGNMKLPEDLKVSQYKEITKEDLNNKIRPNC